MTKPGFAEAWPENLADVRCYSTEKQRGNCGLAAVTLAFWQRRDKNVAVTARCSSLFSRCLMPGFRIIPLWLRRVVVKNRPSDSPSDDNYPTNTAFSGPPLSSTLPLPYICS